MKTFHLIQPTLDAGQFDAHMADRHRDLTLTPLQWYWIGVLHCGMARNIVPDSLMLDLEPDDPKVQQAFDARLSLHDAAAFVFSIAQ